MAEVQRVLTKLFDDSGLDLSQNPIQAVDHPIPPPATVSEDYSQPDMVVADLDRLAQDEFHRQIAVFLSAQDAGSIVAERVLSPSPSDADTPIGFKITSCKGQGHGKSRIDPAQDDDDGHHHFRRLTFERLDTVTGEVETVPSPNDDSQVL